MISKDEFKLSLSRFASGVTVVTYNDSGEMGGITVSSFSSLSLDPPLVCFNLNNDSHSLKVIEKQNQFAIHILSELQEEFSNKFSSSKIDKNEYIKSLSLEYINNLPILPNSMSSLICEKDSLIPAGDHTIVIGKVLSAKTDESLRPLLYYNRGYHKI